MGRTHTRHIPDLGGLAVRMPFTAVALLIAAFASLGLPGTSGFVSEILIFLGTFEVWTYMTIIGASGVVLAAGYMLWTMQRVMFGPLDQRWIEIRDVSRTQYIPIIILVFTIIAIGIYPSVISDVFSVGINDSFERMVDAYPRLTIR